MDLLSRTRVCRCGRYYRGSGAPLTTSLDRAVDFGPSLCSLDQLTAHVAFPFSRYRGAANGCNIGCCSCYDPVHHPGVCCVDAFATQFPQVSNRIEVCFCGEIYDFAPVLSKHVENCRRTLLATSHIFLLARCEGDYCTCSVTHPTATHGNDTLQGTGVAATWNTALVFEMGVVASNESRALMKLPGRHADYRTGASSVINILRDGRWGRAPET
jgi:hypothetical protein